MPGFDHSARTADLLARLRAFMNEHIYPNEALYYQQIDDGDRWQRVPILAELKPKARAAGLWNLFLSEGGHGAGLTNLEYAPLCEVMGRSPGFGPEVFNCSAPRSLSGRKRFHKPSARALTFSSSTMAGTCQRCRAICSW